MAQIPSQWVSCGTGETWRFVEIKLTSNIKILRVSLCCFPMIEYFPSIGSLSILRLWFLNFIKAQVGKLRYIFGKPPPSPPLLGSLGILGFKISFQEVPLQNCHKMTMLIPHPHIFWWHWREWLELSVRICTPCNSFLYNGTWVVFEYKEGKT